MALAGARTEAAPRRHCRYPDCDNWGPPETFRGDYCSEDCRTRHAGRQIIAAIVNDHRYCATCGTQVKTVYHPGDRTRGLANARDVYSRTPPIFEGVQSRLPTADTGEQVHRDDLATPVIRTGTVCGVCGATDLSDPLPWADNPRLIEAAGRYCDALRREGIADPDAETVMHTLAETPDLELAMGRACE